MKTCLVIILAFILWVQAGRPTTSEAIDRMVEGTWEYIKSGQALADAERVVDLGKEIVRFIVRVAKIGQQEE